MTYPLMDAFYSAIFRISTEELAHVEGLRHGYIGHLIEGRRFDSEFLHSHCAHPTTPNSTLESDQDALNRDMGSSRRFYSADQPILPFQEEFEPSIWQSSSSSNQGSRSSSPRSRRDTDSPGVAGIMAVDKTLETDPWPEKRTVQTILAKIEVHAASESTGNWNKARAARSRLAGGNKLSLVTHVAQVQQAKKEIENRRKTLKSQSSDRLYKGAGLSVAAKGSKNNPRYNSDSSLYQPNNGLKMHCEPCANEAKDFHTTQWLDEKSPQSSTLDSQSVNGTPMVGPHPMNALPLVDPRKVPSIRTLLMLKRAAKRRQHAKAGTGFVFTNSARPYQSATLLWDEGDLPDLELNLPDGPMAFQWKGVETLLNGVSSDQLQRQLISLHRLVTSKDRQALAQMVKTTPELDLTLPLRGVTALSLSLYIRQPEITKDLITYLHRLGQLSRAMNMTSVDNASRRETPLITAARTGQSESLELLLLYKDLLDLESCDGEGRTAIWNAVREEHFGVVMQLVENGARIHYSNGDLSCPLQLACKTHLLKSKGKQIVRYLVSHGANLEFLDHAMRNALYWAIYNSCGETAVFLLKAGIQIKPWLWLEDDALPNSILEDKGNGALIKKIRSQPRELKILARTAVRNWLICYAKKKSIYPEIENLSLGEKGKAILKLEEILNLKIRSNPTSTKVDASSTATVKKVRGKC